MLWTKKHAVLHALCRWPALTLSYMQDKNRAHQAHFLCFFPRLFSLIGENHFSSTESFMFQSISKPCLIRRKLKNPIFLQKTKTSLHASKEYLQKMIYIRERAGQYDFAFRGWHCTCSQSRPYTWYWPDPGAEAGNCGLLLSAPASCTSSPQPRCNPRPHQSHRQRSQLQKQSCPFLLHGLCSFTSSICFWAGVGVGRGPFWAWNVFQTSLTRDELFGLLDASAFWSLTKKGKNVFFFADFFVSDTDATQSHVWQHRSNCLENTSRTFWHLFHRPQA